MDTTEITTQETPDLLTYDSLIATAAEYRRQQNEAAENSFKAEGAAIAIEYLIQAAYGGLIINIEDPEELEE